MQKTLQKLTELLKGVAILCKYMKTICLSKSWRTSQRCGIFVLYFWILFKNYIIKLLQIIKTIRMNFSIGNVKISWAFKLLIYISQYFQYTVIYRKGTVSTKKKIFIQEAYLKLLVHLLYTM